MDAIYYPILRLKKGEIIGVSHLNPRTVSRIRPVFDLLKLAPDESVEVAQNLAMRDIARVWGREFPFLVDTWRYDTRTRTADARHPVEHLFDCADQLHLRALPMLGTESFRGSDYLRAAAKISRARGGAGIRLFIEDFDSPETTQRSLSEILGLVELEPARCELLLDFGSRSRTLQIAPTDGDLIALVSNAANVAAKYGFASIVICGTSVPEQVGRVHNNEPCRTARVEFEVWQRVAQQKGPLPRFGDYAAMTPLAHDGKGYSRPPSRIRLATHAQLVSFRADGGRYRQLCMEVVRTPEFASQVRSWGASEIERTVLVRAASSPTDMVARDTNMHVELTERFWIGCVATRAAIAGFCRPGAAPRSVDFA